MAFPLLIPIADALAKVGGAALAKIGGAAALKGLGAAAAKTAATSAATQLAANGVNALSSGGGGGGGAVAGEATPINIPQMALQNKMAEMKTNTQAQQAPTVQPVQSNNNMPNNQDMIKRRLLGRLGYGGTY